MTKRTMLISSVLLTIGIGTFVFYNVSNDNEIIESTNRDNLKVNSNALTMMYEIEADSGEYQVSSDTMWPEEGYTFNAELSKCENGSKLSWDDENKRVVMQANTSDKCYVYFDKGPSLADLCSGKTFAECITTQVYTGADGENDLYYHDGSGSYTNADQEAGDNSYRYAGANPNNYVCFGSDEAVCSEDNLYRIIGVFDDQVKLIKATSYGGYAWDSGSSNTWDETTKPDIYTTLNTTYYNTLGSGWQNLITESTWQVGGMAVNRNTAKQYYDVEVGTGQSGYEETMKIGLMYVSDYGYGASPEKWTTALSSTSSNYGIDNWLYLGSDEWTISRRVYEIPINTFFVSSDSFVSANIFCSSANAVRPSFYLQPWVLYSGGDGTLENPYKISAPENLISFTLIDTVYYAEDGMTWNEWIDSIYCADKSLFYIDVGPYNQFVNYKDEPFAAEFKYYAMGNDLIINGAKYYRSTQPYG